MGAKRKCVSDMNRLLAFYPEDCRPQRLEDLGGAGGFSGAAFWRLTTPRGLLCLRRWPSQADPSDPKWSQRLGFIHAVLEHVARRGFSLVPIPIRTRQGNSHLQLDDFSWELSPWLAGHADYLPLRRPEKLRAAMTALAEFHRAAADFGIRGIDCRPAASPGVRARRHRIEQLRAGGLQAIATAVDAAPRPAPGCVPQEWIALVELARRLLPLYSQAEEPVLRQLVAAEPIEVPMQPCIRDIWHDHVLFEGDRVSGLIDFGAMRVDNVACDAARLLGSLADDDAGVWQEGLAAYLATRPLSRDEQNLVGVFDRSTTLLAGMNWLEWIFLQRRTFAEPPAVIARLGRIVSRMERLTKE
jgi:homoserine kinase type II